MLPLRTTACVTIAEVVRRAAAAARRAAHRRGVAVEVSGAAAAPVVGDEELLRAAVADLLAHAVRASPAGAVVRVALREELAWIQVDVDDAGRALDDTARARLLDPLCAWRPGDPGHALARGLRVLFAHGGTAAVAATPAGNRVTVRLPACLP